MTRICRISFPMEAERQLSGVCQGRNGRLLHIRHHSSMSVADLHLCNDVRARRWDIRSRWPAYTNITSRSNL
jgi:hypothetical protein